MTPAEETALGYTDRDLDRDEGTVPWCYKDSEGWWTIGRGILCDARKKVGLRPEEIAFINRNRLLLLLKGVQGEPWYPAVANDAVRLAAILNMQFQLGANSDEDFATSFALIAKRDWKGAANAMRQSRWAKQQTPARAARVAKQIETGVRA